MQAVGIILVLISIGTIVAPIGIVAYTYRDNLLQLVVPPQLEEFMGDNGIVSGNVTGTGNNVTDNGGGFIAPVIVDKQINQAARTFSLTVNFTNTFSFNLTLNQLSAYVGCSQHSYLLGTVQLASPVVINTGQTTQLQISGAWTSDAESHVRSEHPGATAIDVNLVNLTIEVNGIEIQQTEPVAIGAVPLS